MSNRKPLLLGIGIVIAAICVAFVWATLQVVNGPRWQLSATNAEEGLKLEVFQEGRLAPTFTTVLPNHRVAFNITRTTIDELPPDVGHTTFTDETVKPGRWKLVMDGVELDIMSLALVVDGKQEISPATDVD